jgi:hypothetical protein
MPIKEILLFLRAAGFLLWAKSKYAKALFLLRITVGFMI